MLARNRSGFALPLAIGAIVLIGTMVTGVFFVATQENRLGNNTLTQEKSFRAAEGMLNYAFGNWNNIAMNNMAVGSAGTVTQTYDSLSTKGWKATVNITRLTTVNYWLTSEATSGTTDGARHRTGMVVRIVRPQINFLGALTIRGAVNIGGASFIEGNDSIPDGWTECPPTSTTMPGIAMAPNTTLTRTGCLKFNCVDGEPDIKRLSEANDTSTYFNYGADANWATLTASATRTFSGDQSLTQIGPSVANGICNVNDPKNWGDPGRANPTGACESYFPIIFFSGRTSTVHLTTGKGQGILLVDGDLLVDGGFEWFGPVIVRGHVTTQGTGGHFNGGVMAADVDLEQNTVLGDALVQFSSCAINEALVGSGVAKRIPARAWAYVF
jgi:hypothetical protein